MTLNQEDIGVRIGKVRERVTRACGACGRAVDEVTLLAVSKTFDATAVLAAVEAGQRQFGENYVGEAVAKIEHFRALGNAAPPLVWHMIGPLQSNKTKLVATHFDWMHSIDRLKIAQRLSEQRPPELPPLQVCLEVNVSGEPSKSGVRPEDLAALADAVVRLPGLQLRGLMCIPEPQADPVAQRRPFAETRGLLRDLQRRGHELDTLSMGMSADLEAAIAEGATIVRVGTAIFGHRDYGAAA